MGIGLYDGRESKRGNVTWEVKLWDAGTEPNEYPGAGIHQGPGGTDENGKVMIVHDRFRYPDVYRMIRVSITRN